jgi:isopentenyl-diphosphate Delta-isomerase
MERITDILNENGTSIDIKSLDEAHAKGLLHRSVHVLVVDDTGKVFVRKRPLDKPIYPGLWTSSVGTHVLHGMNPGDVAQTALKDFLGLDTPVQQLGEQRIQDEFENEIITVYSCKANAITGLNPNESSEGAFMTVEQVQQLGNAHDATPHLIGALGVYQNSLAV